MYYNRARACGSIEALCNTGYLLVACYISLGVQFKGRGVW